MDSITSLIKAEIKKQYGSVAKFAEASGIPYGTISNALACRIRCETRPSRVVTIEIL